MLTKSQALETLCALVNKVKRTSYQLSDLHEDAYLGGNLGIDSVQMLEIWFDLGKALDIKIADEAKRDIYTVGQLLDVLHSHAAPRNPVEA